MSTDLLCIWDISVVTNTDKYTQNAKDTKGREREKSADNDDDDGVDDDSKSMDETKVLKFRRFFWRAFDAILFSLDFGCSQVLALFAAG